MEPCPVSKRPLQSPLIGDQHADGYLVGQADRFKDLLGVGQLRDHVRADKARDLDPAKPRAAEEFDKADLLGGWYHLGLVLETISRTDLTHLDARRKLAA